MLNKSVGQEEVGYYKSFCRFKNHIRVLRYIYDVLSMRLSFYVQCLFYHELSNFRDEILLKGLLKGGGECNSRDFQTLN